MVYFLWCARSSPMRGQLVMHHVYSCIYILLRLASKYLNCTRRPHEIVQKLHKYDWKHKVNTSKIDSDNFTKLPATFLGENNNENQVKFAVLSSSVKRENRLKLCQATWTTHSHSEKFNKMFKNFANFAWFSLLFPPKKVAGSLVKLSESIFEVFILCFQSCLCSLCTILRVQFRYLLANLRKIYIHE